MSDERLGRTANTSAFTSGVFADAGFFTSRWNAFEVPYITRFNNGSPRTKRSRLPRKCLTSEPDSLA